ncbi:hypothetical protein ACHAXT_008750 [Thalassiosira profunda]
MATSAHNSTTRDIMTLPSRSIALCLAAAALRGAAAFSPTARPRTHRDAPSTTARSAVAFPELSIPNHLFESKDARRSQLKRGILELAAETKRGLTATEEQQQEMEQLFQQLEKLNPTPNPLKREEVNGDWSLEYTTSDSILGKGGFPRVGPIIQNIDTTTLSAKNSETVRYLVLDVPRSVTAELSPKNGKFTDVKFKRFQLGPVGFDAPDKFRGSLDITYLDDEVRLTRGDKGNIFVLTRM